MSAKVAAIVAAAGRSERMGTCKQLLDLGGKTVIGRCLETLHAGGIGEIVVVVGSDGERVASEVRCYPVQVAVNPDPAGDMASSVQVGLASLPPTVSGVVVALCDYPLVSPATISALVHAHATGPDLICIPSHGGRNGHPTLFPLHPLAELVPGRTLRDLVRQDPRRVQRIVVDDPGILQDMDTPEDYRRICDMFAR